jgi:hypothetical protein
MSPRLNQEQLPTKQPTMWDSLAQASSLVGRVGGGYTFAHAFGTLASKRIARRLGNPEDSP